MKTKRVELYCDLHPGWQDDRTSWCALYTTPPDYDKREGNKRIKVIVDLPCFGGSADVDATVEGKSEVIG